VRELKDKDDEPRSETLPQKLKRIPRKERKRQASELFYLARYE
jgi:hypothetical protein